MNITLTILYNIMLVLQCYDLKKVKKYIHVYIVPNNLNIFSITKINVTILTGYFVLIVFLTSYVV